jgi:hypothetical protein
MQIEHLPSPGQHIGIDHVTLVLAADRPTQPGSVPSAQQGQIAARVT